MGKFGLSSNPNITIEIIDKYPNKDWNWECVLKTIKITIEMIQNNPSKYWDWFYISENPNVTLEFIKYFKEKRFSWYNFSPLKNKNLTMQFIEKYNEYPLDWQELSKSSLDVDYQNTMKQLKRNFQTVEEELIAKAWHPSRFQEWCLNEDEKNEDD